MHEDFYDTGSDNCHIRIREVQKIRVGDNRYVPAGNTVSNIQSDDCADDLSKYSGERHIQILYQIKPESSCVTMEAMKLVTEPLSQNELRQLKHSQMADGAGYLYRSAFMLAKGNRKQGMQFLHIASEKNPDTNVKMLMEYSKNQQNTLLLAEKVLDEYKRQMTFLRSNNHR